MRSVTGWTDSSVVLYWLNEKGNYKQFVGNRVNKIREKNFINWYSVPTKKNPSDIGSRGSLNVNISRVWWVGPSWLLDKTKWPDHPFITFTTESEKETKCIKELVTTAIQSNETSEYHYLLSKYELHKTLRILAWIYRFMNNSRKVKKSGPLTTEEIEGESILLSKPRGKWNIVKSLYIIKKD